MPFSKIFVIEQFFPFNDHRRSIFRKYCKSDRFELNLRTRPINKKKNSVHEKTVAIKTQDVTLLSKNGKQSLITNRCNNSDYKCYVFRFKYIRMFRVINQGIFFKTDLS